MDSRCLLLAVCLVVSGAGAPALAVTNLATNPGFEDFDAVDGPGDGWGSFGAAGFNAFFGANGHASLFPDTAGNTGGVFQLGIPAVEGQTYQFDLLDTRIEASYDASTRFGLEFYAADDTTKLGESLVEIDAAERLALPNVDGGGAVNAAVFSVRGTAPVGASIVRPIILYDNVSPFFLAQPQANVFVFDSFLSATPAPGGNLLKNPGFEEDFNQDGGFGDVWRFFGNSGANDFFGGNAHASVFADTAGNSGGFFQQSILADEGVTYEFELADVRIEESFDARLRFGLEYYGSDDFSLLGADLVEVDTSVTGDGLSFSMQATPVAGTVYVRPIVLFDEVNPSFLAQPQSSLFVFEAALREAVDSGLPGDFNSDGKVDLVDLDVLGQNFGLLSGATLAQGDANGDGAVDLVDLDILGQNFGAMAAAATPEPSTAVTALVALGAFASRRRVR